MRLSTSTGYIAKKLGLEGALSAIKKAGFDAYDLSLRELSGEDCPIAEDNYMEFAKKVKALADEEGLVCNQAHATFPPKKFGDDEYNKKTGGDWRIMPPPCADIATGQHKIAKSIAPFAGIAVLKGEGEQENAAFAVVEAYFSNYVDRDNKQSENIRLARVYTENDTNPSRYLSVPVSEDEMRVNTHLHGMLSAFLKGEIPMTRWADFAAQLKEKGTEEMIGQQRSAYNSAKK